MQGKVKRIEVTIEEDQGLFIAKSSSMGRGHAGLTATAASRDGALHMIRQEAKSMGLSDVEIVEVSREAPER